MAFVYDISFSVWRRGMKPQLVLQLQAWLLLILGVAAANHTPIISHPGCKDTCGDVSIPYPFGIGPNGDCFLDDWFEIECKASPDSASGSTSFLPFLSKLHLEVMELNAVSNRYFSPANLIVKIPYLKVCDAETQKSMSINLTGSPYYFSGEDNVFIVEGCPGSAVVLDERDGIAAGCATVCNTSNKGAIPTNTCYGVQCCQTPYTLEASYYRIEFILPDSGETQNCFGATIIDSESADDYAGILLSTEPPSTIPVVLNWRRMKGLPANKSSHSYCHQDDFSSNCRCDYEYEGNPYVVGGCRVSGGCKGCRGSCYQRYGSKGRIIPNSYHCQGPAFLPAILGLSISFGVILLVIIIYGLYRFIKRRRELKRRAKFFKRNGGLLLQQQLSSNEGVLEKTKIFTMSELGKATDHFNENRILGQGGQGTVYKGMLMDGRIVAIKKAKLLDESQLEQFINEVVILSQINHRNVVKLLGCCLETEVPLLVYEFIPNGTLSQHIYDPNDDFVIGWEMLLKIAADSASAIAYLHSFASIPIYHRDIKSSNILLDEKHRAKVSDFGSSKTIAIDQTHLTTLVQGTMGYLDPEYFQSYQFTEKSDVYSFGVVLLELLTRKKPIYNEGSITEQKNLVTEFLHLAENSGLSNIIDHEIAKQAKEEELTAVVNLAKCCVSWSGKLRPKMMQVAMTLEMIIKSPAQASSWYEQVFRVPQEGTAEKAMAEASEADFMSSPLTVGAYSPLCIDVQPLLPHTI